MKPSRLGEYAIDEVLRDAMPLQIEKSDRFGDPAELSGDAR